MQMEDRPLAPQEFRVRTRLTGISAGTELSHYRGMNPGFQRGRLSYPRKALGYELLGVVVEAGTDVRDVRVGDRVFAMAPHGDGCILDTRTSRFKVVPPHLSDEESLGLALTTTAVHGVHASQAERAYQMIDEGKEMFLLVVLDWSA
jgi:threonine dehydrogenase-like Zn-dependent dehydrogenase